MRRHTITCLCLSLLTAAGAVAQQDRAPKLKPNSFFPQEYTWKGYVDLKALRDTDLYEELESNVVARPMFGMMRRQFGFRIDDLDRIRMGGVAVVDKEENVNSGQRQVVVIEGNRKLKLPRPRKDEIDWNRRTPTTIAGHDVVQEGIDPSEDRSWYKPGLWVQVNDKCLVYGDKRLMEPVLEGKRRGGVPHAELMAFTAGRRPLAYMAGKLAYDKDQLRYAMPFPFEWYTDEDVPEFFMIRLNIDAKTQATSVSMHLRFQTGKHGPQHFKTSMLEGIKEGMKKQKEMKVFEKFFNMLKYKIDGTDLVISVGFGSAKETLQALTLQQMMPLLMFYAFAADEAVMAGKAVEVVQEAEPAEPAVEVEKKKDVPKPKEAKKKKEPPKIEKAGGKK